MEVGPERVLVVGQEDGTLKASVGVSALILVCTFVVFSEGVSTEVSVSVKGVLVKVVTFVCTGTQTDSVRRSSRRPCQAPTRDSHCTTTTSLGTGPLPPVLTSPSTRSFGLSI